ncbi:MAG: flagellar basal body M-ring protein FliF [Gallionella sp.]|nr:flagellar basal body M-ring protein FliF [Gallionella sp.]OIO09214.1 MAG: flagellar M-ring protein FliF [Gallionellaceae bacterium CG1_02_60_325]PIR09996.1 MAG: flagellar M-ring protein FliF [Gallionellaceae bacterium CG11_big_fil_rev_8_21_14_0_20_60_62]PIV47725.1 MAG: flagellar basal body M-ring protein FliF [Gallionellaceae bacterium CG02_land_8_20_14_3_00_60_115]PJC04252.1 MAG: flagellar basal body M-ring protein FliF [Gallionellaceae bacterium CG_4_9_14_0_8_um_filter_60_335]
MADTNTLSSNPGMAQLLIGIPSQQKLGLIVAVAATVALLSGLWLWGQTPDYRVLYANLAERDGGAVIESLQQQNIPYKFAEGGGALMVPASRVHEVRLKMATLGLPKGGTAGFELMENQKFGTSQFLEQVNFQRALEGELARSVQTMAAVSNARVHLAIPKPSVFIKDKQKPTASVVLALYAGRALDEGQVNAIVHLISSSVPEMRAENVTVVDQNGNLLSASADGKRQMLDASQMKYVRQIEQDYVQRILDILSPITGTQNVRAQVTASLDFTEKEQTSESYAPNQPPNAAAVRSMQSTESLDGVKTAGGVPGALSNQPPVPATAPIVAPANALPAVNGAATEKSLKEQRTNYEVDRTIQHTRLPVGNIKRLSVAVVLNNRSVADAEGKMVSTPYSEEEKNQISALVREAVGFEVTRGDSLNLLNSAFNDTQEVLEAIPLWQQPEIIALTKDLLKYLLIGGGVIYLLFGIIRPAFRRATENAMEQEEHSEGEEGGGTEGEEGSAKQDGTHRQSGNSYDHNLQVAKQLAKDDPKIVATVVKEWVNKE